MGSSSINEFCFAFPISNSVANSIIQLLNNLLCYLGCADPSQWLTDCPHSGAEERIRRVRAGKLVGCDEDTLMSEAKLCMQAKQNTEFIHYFSSAGRCLAASWKAAQLIITWEDKLHNHKLLFLPCLFPRL